jgi:hypothetical protein
MLSVSTFNLSDASSVHSSAELAALLFESANSASVFLFQSSNASSTIVSALVVFASSNYVFSSSLTSEFSYTSSAIASMFVVSALGMEMMSSSMFMQLATQ